MTRSMPVAARADGGCRPAARTALAVAIGACLVTLGASAVAQTARLGFDDLPDGTRLTGQYGAQGLTLGCLKGPHGSCDNAAITARPAAGTGSARSGSQVLSVAPARAAPWPAFDESDGWLHLHFARPAQTVTVHARAVVSGSGSGGNTPYMQAFDAGNHHLATVELPSGSPGSDWQALTIQRAQADIAYVVVSSYNTRGGPTVRVLVDDVSFAPMQVTPWTAAAAGRGFSLGLRGDGSLWAWGANDRRQLGQGDAVACSVPAKVGGNDWSAVAAGREHVLALKTDGTLWAWGGNAKGQVGDGSLADRATPVRIGSASDWEVLAAGADHSLAVRREPVTMGDRHSVWSWGSNDRGQLGDPAVGAAGRAQPGPVLDALQYQEVAAGDGFSVGRTRDPVVYVWGVNDHGQLGTGDRLPVRQPTLQARRPAGFLAGGQVGAEGSHVLLADPFNLRMLAWGRNDQGQLGNGGTADLIEPTPLAGGWTRAIAAGRAHTLALKNGPSGLWAWGANADGQLGDGGTAGRSVPQQVGTALDWTAVAAGSAHSLGIRADGSLWSWGGNTQGELGLRHRNVQRTPARVADFLVSVTGGTHGRVSPSGAVAAVYGESLAFDLAPDAGYTPVATGCGGRVEGARVLTASITGDCTVQVRFDGPRADLSVPRLRVPVSAKAGATVALTAEVRNGGALPAPASSACLMVGPNLSLAARPSQLACVAVPVLAPGASHALRQSVLLPRRLAAGSWRLTLRADAADQVDENNEADNSASAVIRITAP